MLRELPNDIGLKAAFVKNRDKALAYPQEKLPRGRGDSTRARHNIFQGLLALEPHRATLEKRWLPQRVEALFAAGDIANALVFAALEAERADQAEKTLVADIATAYEFRDQILSALETAVKFGLIPSKGIDAIRAGSGPLDASLDLIAGVTEYRKHAKKLVNKTPVTPEFLAAAEKLGNDLVPRITPKGQTSLQPAVVDEKAQARDLALRFYALVADAHHEARLAGNEIWGNSASHAHVPALQAVAKKPAAKKTEEKPEKT